MSSLQSAVEMIQKEFISRFMVVPSIYLSVSTQNLSREEATKIAEEVAKELNLSPPTHNSNMGVFWVDAEKYAPRIELTVFYDIQEENRCNQYSWKVEK